MTFQRPVAAARRAGATAGQRCLAQQVAEPEVRDSVDIGRRQPRQRRADRRAEYKIWKGFYENNFAAVNNAIQAKDLAAFKKSYSAVIADCNNCHKAMEYGFIKVVQQKAPSDQGIDYTLKSQPGDVPK
jgi:cytochrome c556